MNYMFSLKDFNFLLSYMLKYGVEVLLEELK